MGSSNKCQHLTSGLAKLGGKVITRISARPLTVGDNPNCVQLRPNFAKPPGRCMQTDGSTSSITKFNKEFKNQKII